MGNYFTKFPNILYDLSGNPNSDPIIVKNIFFRLKIVDAIETNSLVYYPYFVKQNETPEIIAYKYYKDTEKHWLVLMVNQIIDPRYDWPLADQSFINYITAKYGSVDDAQTLIESYQLSVVKEDSVSGASTETLMTIDLTTYNSTPSFTFQEINLQDGSTVAITTTTNIVYAFDTEFANNETKKQIQLLDKKYVDEIQSEFDALTSKARR